MVLKNKITDRNTIHPFLYDLDRGDIKIQFYYTLSGCLK